MAERDEFARFDRFEGSPSGRAVGGEWSGQAEDHVVDSHPAPAYARWAAFSDEEIAALEEATNVWKDDHGDRLPSLYTLREQLAAEMRRRGLRVPGDA